jgi:Protein of unknown function (DUF429)
MGLLIRIVATIIMEGIKPTYLGIDFGGNHLMWRPNRKGNIYIATVCCQQECLVLTGLQRVQCLPGDEPPFQRLIALLKTRNFAAAAIDAPFSIPRVYMPSGGHRDLLDQVAGIERDKNRPFPTAQGFASRFPVDPTMSSMKPLRKTELAWSEQGINVRSTLWAGPRGGAAMTAACLTLLHDCHSPIWPWDPPSESGGLLVEAFPAAQLCHWKLEFQGYNGNEAEAASRRKDLVASVSNWIEIPDDSFRKEMEDSADALDAVLCAFAAIAVTTNQLAQTPIPGEEGAIAVHERIKGKSVCATGG